MKPSDLDEVPQPTRDQPIREIALRILESLPDAVLVVDDAGQIVYALGATQEVLGWLPDQLVGTSVDHLVPPEHRRHHPELRAQFHASMRRRPMGESEYLVAVKADGSSVPVSIMLTPFEWGRTSFVIAVIRDAHVTHNGGGGNEF